jgi:ferredoxin
MGYTVRIDKQRCQSSGRCVHAEPKGFALDSDHLASLLPGAALLSDGRLLEIARQCPALAIAVLDEQGNEVDL